MTGHWRGSYHFRLTNPSAMRADVRSFLDRLSVRTFAWVRRCRIETTVAWIDAGTVRHTTRLSLAGVTGWRSEEDFRLEADGRSLAVRMRRIPIVPGLPLVELPHGSGTVLDPPTGADYILPGIGGMIRQQVRISEDCVTLRQQGDWFTAEGLLRREHPDGASNRGNATR